MMRGARHNGWSVLQRYQALPEPIRMIATAFIGAAIGFMTYQLCYAVIPWQPRTTISWLLAFLINVARQHALHRSLTFRDCGPYWPSLGRAYLMYSASAVATTALNWCLTILCRLNHELSWLICMGLTATMSLLFLKRFVFMANTESTKRHAVSRH